MPKNKEKTDDTMPDSAEAITTEQWADQAQEMLTDNISDILNPDTPDKTVILAIRESEEDGEGIELLCHGSVYDRAMIARRLLLTLPKMAAMAVMVDLVSEL